MKGRGRDRGGEVSHLLIYSTNVHNIWDCTEPRPGCENSVRVSHVGARNPGLFSTHLLPPGVHDSRKLECPEN